MSALAFMSVAVLLAFVIILGIRQYQLGKRYNTVITQSEKIIFSILHCQGADHYVSNKKRLWKA